MAPTLPVTFLLLPVLMCYYQGQGISRPEDLVPRSRQRMRLDKFSFEFVVFQGVCRMKSRIPRPLSDRMRPSLSKIEKYVGGKDIDGCHTEDQSRTAESI